MPYQQEAGENDIAVAEHGVPARRVTEAGHEQQHWQRLVGAPPRGHLSTAYGTSGICS